MSQAILANQGKNETEKSWKDVRWIRSKDRGSQDTTNTALASTAPSPSKSRRIKDKKAMSSTFVEAPVSEVMIINGKDSQHTTSISTSTRRRGPRLPFTKDAATELEGSLLVEPPKALITQDGIGSKSKSTSSLSNLARRGSWIIRSKSPSGHRRTPSTNVSKPEKAVVTKTQPSPSKPERESTLESSPIPRRPSLASSNRPLSAIFTRSASSPQISTNLRHARSIERLPTIEARSPSAVPDVPTPVTPTRIQKFQATSLEPVRKRDELWNVFRNLDSEYIKFINKPASFKVTVIRSCLLPFLQRYAQHPSNVSLRAEDLDRRVQILNKWWTALLEMINGRNGYGLAPSDRPAILDALTGIMQRPEWRQTITSLTSSRQNSSRLSPSLENSGGSDFLAETVLSNARSMFVQHLLSQMNFAVDRMSLRTVAASVVAFCGKAIAYAFLFCPGVADVLVRLWNQPQVNLRRVLDETGIVRNTNLKSTADGVASLFPAHLQHLCLRTLPSLCRILRDKSPIRINLDYINWDGPWIGRWSGRDSDLFFSFTKHYHTLLCEFLGEDATDKERMCAPGAVMVYGQLLAIMDATIQVHKSPYVPSQAVTFDDILGADASAPAMTVRAPNTARLMTENRLIMLLREVLADSWNTTPAVKISFAVLYGNLLKAATKRTSVTDGDACFILCDFLEESMFILARFFQNAEDPIAFLDWPFWLDVLKRLGGSNNTMTEVRLYALIYNLWGYIAKDESKKKDLCLDWLLQEDYAYQQFNHWCPMVRAYYHRLLIWRIARCNGTASALDLEIYTALLSLLQRLFSQYLYKLSTAEQQGSKIPSSTPASPAPGRRLLIIRDDSVPSPATLLTSLMASSTDHTTYQKLTSFDALDKLSEGPDLTEKATKKRFSFLRNFNPFVTSTPSPESSNSVSPQNSPPSSTHTPGESTGTSTPESESSRPNTPPTPTPEFLPNRSFKFSLEWVDRPYPYRMDRKLYPPRLPPTSQAMVPQEFAEAILLGDAIPSKDEEAASKYVGVALAEWSILVIECTSFAERRRYEGVPTGREETPVLGVETFRKPIG